MPLAGLRYPGPVSESQPLPAFESTVELDPETLASFRAKGHAVVRGLATAAELAAVRPAIEAKALELAWDKRPLDQRETYGKAFLQSFNLWRVDPVIRRFVFAPRFARAAADLLGVGGVRLYHDQALFKEPGGGRTPWHQDQFYWPLDTDATITMWMPLVDVPSEVGSMIFASGSHKLGDLRGQAISDESDRTFARLIVERGLATETHGALAAGDATFHAGWTVHSAGENPTGRMRPVMTVIYVADGARVGEVTPGQELDHKAWLRSKPPGELVDSDRNPRLWPPL